MRERTQTLRETFHRLFGSEPAAIVRGPGRVDLLGSHTDYNDGFVLPVAVSVDVLAAGRLRQDRKVVVHSANFDKTSEFGLDAIEPDTGPNKWSNYVRGVVKYLLAEGVELQGADIAMSGNVPIGSGLSSSAAIEMAAGFLLQTLIGFEMSGKDLALIGQKAENLFVGVNTGIMDQFISRLGRKGSALFLDCREMTHEHVPLDTTVVKIVVCDTMKRRGLVDSEYGLRRKQCEEARDLLKQWVPGVKALRDVSAQDLETYSDRLPEVVRKRARHVIYENERVLASRDVLGAGNFVEFGKMMDASHESARDLYEVSCPELEAMVRAGRAAPGALCGRLAGAGFGGCTVSLVEDGLVDGFLAAVREQYTREVGVEPALYVCTAEDGASVVTD